MTDRRAEGFLPADRLIGWLPCRSIGYSTDRPQLPYRLIDQLCCRQTHNFPDQPIVLRTKRSITLPMDRFIALPFRPTDLLFPRRFDTLPSVSGQPINITDRLTFRLIDRRRGKEGKRRCTTYMKSAIHNPPVSHYPQNKKCGRDYNVKYY